MKREHASGKRLERRDLLARGTDITDKHRKAAVKPGHRTCPKRRAKICGDEPATQTRPTSPVERS